MELKVYISGKITGEDPVACKVKFLAMEVRLKGMGIHTVINPKNIGIPDSWPWAQAMERCLRVLKEDANTIVMLNDWLDSKGAMEEYNYAKAHDYLIVFEQDIDHLFELAKVKYKSLNTSDISDNEKPRPRTPFTEPILNYT
jgi:hypothetical protein